MYDVNMCDVCMYQQSVENMIYLLPFCVCTTFSSTVCTVLNKDNHRLVVLFFLFFFFLIYVFICEFDFLNLHSDIYDIIYYFWFRSKLTIEDKQAWKIPPCVSNWKVSTYVCAIEQYVSNRKISTQDSLHIDHIFPCIFYIYFPYISHIFLHTLILYLLL